MSEEKRACVGLAKDGRAEEAVKVDVDARRGSG